MGTTPKELELMETHAHEVMRLMLELDNDFSRESLAQAIIDQLFIDLDGLGHTVGDIRRQLAALPQ